MAKIAPILLLLNLNCLLQAEASSDGPLKTSKDLRWPQRQVKVLVDNRSLNESERQVVANMLDQLEHRTCLRIERLLNDQVNPFAPLSSQNLAHREQNKEENYNNFIYIFKAQFGRHHSSPSIGLSSFGCLRQGRQSIILTDLAFKWPQQILSYHLMRSLGVANLTRPDSPRLRSSSQLPASQRIGSSSALDMVEDIEPYLAYASKTAPSNQMKHQDLYLSEWDLSKVKELYSCSEYQSRLSMPLKPTIDDSQNDAISTTSSLKLDQSVVTSSLTPQPPSPAVDLQSTSDMGDAAEVVEPTFPESHCDPLESCPLVEPPEAGSGERLPRLEKEGKHLMKPIILELDSFHSQDPQLQQTNQMKLSFVQPSSGGTSENAQSFRLMNAPLTGADQQQVRPNKPAGNQQEMLISFEQAEGANASSNPIAALASSQLLKLCSCTCQTMSPSTTSTSGLTTTPATTTPITSEPTSQTRSSEPEETWPVTQQPPFTLLPSFPSTTKFSTSNDPKINESTTIEATTLPPTTEKFATTQPIATTVGPTTTTGNPATITFTSPAWTETLTSTEMSTSSTSPKSTKSEKPPPSSGGSTINGVTATTTPLITSPPKPASPSPPPEGYCDQVEWVKPNKTVYGSARIVWDVDRANQNYFLCQNIVNGELVPGKTHGLACQVSSEGKAYELHNFHVLTKPEQVSLAWVQRNNSAFGRQNLPVVGGYSKLDGDPYLVSRCLVRDENNDVINLIGYVNGQGQGWFPFDDIQIECSLYDVLACV